MDVALHETLTGAIAPPGRPLDAAPLALDLTLRGRGLLEVALGAPFAAEGTFERRADDTSEAGLPRQGVVWGTARLLVPRGIFYDLRLAGRRDAGAAEVLALAGARRFARGDLYASATTLDGEVRRGDVPVATVRLRFDARDDLGALLRSLRVGGGSIALGRR